MRAIEPSELAAATAQLVLGASESIDVSGLSAVNWFHPRSGGSWEEVRHLADQRLRLRALVMDFPMRIITKDQAFREAQTNRMEAFVEGSWQIRRPVSLPPYHALIVDGEVAIFTHLNMPHKDDLIYITEDPDQVAFVQRHFNAAWHGDAILLHQEHLPAPEVGRDPPLVAFSDTWDRLIRHCTADPNELHQLDPRRFEELVAELLSRENMDVEITPRSKDGGRDVLAYANSPIGRHLFYVECEKYSADNPVDVGLVRQLYGVLEAERATAGLLVTTYRFTRGEIQFQRKIEHRMALRDFERLSKWIYDTMPTTQTPNHALQRPAPGRHAAAVAPSSAVAELEVVRPIERGIDRVDTTKQRAEACV